METRVQEVDGAAAHFLDRRTKVWLQCNGEPYDHRSVEVVEATSLVYDIESVEFICPRCGKRHQSLLFR